MKTTTSLIAKRTLIVFFLLSSELAFGCSRDFPTFEVFRDFSVVVQGPRGMPLEGIAVTVYRLDTKPKALPEEIAKANTGKDGHAFFHGIAPGQDYFVSAQHGDVAGGAGQLKVLAMPSSKSSITLAWPGTSFLKLQTVAGALEVGKEYAPLAGAKVEVTDALSLLSLGITSTDERGTFGIKGVTAGFYVLHIQQPPDCDHGCNIKGHILIEIDANASSIRLPRYGLFMGSCGLGAYKEDGSMVLFEL